MRAGRLSLILLLGAVSLEAQVQGRIDAGVDLHRTGQAGAGWLTASWFKPIGGPVLLELTGTAQGQHGTGFIEAGALRAGPRVHLRASDRGVWFGLQAGRDYLGSVRRWEAAAWKTIGRLSIQVQGWQTATNQNQSTGVDSSVGLPDTLTPPSDNSHRIRTTTDLGVWLRWGGGRTELALASGMRYGLREPGLGVGLGDGVLPPKGRSTVSSTWWMAEGTYWLLDRIGIVGTVGRQPTDPSVAATGEGFFRLGFRAALQRRSVERPALLPRRSTAFRTERNGELVEFILLAPEAQRVEMMGDFTDWAPVSMEREGGAWRVRLPTTPGMHRINVRYDGGAWRAPPVTRILHDEFGAESGELLIG